MQQMEGFKVGCTSRARHLLSRLPTLPMHTGSDSEVGQGKWPLGRRETHQGLVRVNVRAVGTFEPG
jgi:hypothetical protein